MEEKISKDAVITVTASGMVASTGIDETNATRVAEVLTRVSSQILSIVNQPKDTESGAEVDTEVKKDKDTKGEA